MRIPRFHLDGELREGAIRALPEPAARHAARVLRLRPGDPLCLFDGRGGEHRARVVALAGARMEVRVEEPLAARGESPLALTLAQAVARGERMDWLVQKATELGVAVIQPLITERCVVRLDGARGERRAAHWRAVACAACEQCGRAVLPEVRAPLPFAEWLAGFRGAGMMLDPEAGRGPGALPHPGPRLALLVGPEGGLSAGERRAARAAGLEPVALGPRTLRTETAALAALTLAQALWGDL